MTVLDEETTNRLFGNLKEEIPEAAYRLGAEQFARRVRNRLLSALESKDPEKAKAITSLVETEAGEAVVAFLLAAALEFIPIESLGDERRRLAYNLRIDALEVLGEIGLKWIEFFAPELEAYKRVIGASNGQGNGKKAQETKKEVGEIKEFMKAKNVSEDKINRFVNEAQNAKTPLEVRNIASKIAPEAMG